VLSRYPLDVWSMLQDSSLQLLVLALMVINFCVSPGSCASFEQTQAHAATSTLDNCFGWVAVFDVGEIDLGASICFWPSILGFWIYVTRMLLGHACGCVYLVNYAGGPPWWHANETAWAQELLWWNWCCLWFLFGPSYFQFLFMLLCVDLHHWRVLR
jgi:hypothetical protein